MSQWSPRFYIGELAPLATHMRTGLERKMIRNIGQLLDVCLFVSKSMIFELRIQFPFEWYADQWYQVTFNFSTSGRPVVDQFFDQSRPGS